MAYPLQVGDFLRGLGGKTAAHMGLNFLTRPGARAGFRRWEEDRSEVTEDIGFENFHISDLIGTRGACIPVPHETVGKVTTTS